jgi:type II secretory pathway pseudopilin PulG
MSPLPSPLPFLVRRLLLVQRLRSSQSAAIPHPDLGLTLIECLVAIIIITLTVVAITPPIFIATASRIQSRRADQANQIAQAEIDRVRTIMERRSYKVEDLPATVAQLAATDTVETKVAVATSPSSVILSPTKCNSNYPPTAAPVAVTDLVPVDVDGDCTPEFGMQVFRTVGCSPASAPDNPLPYSFTMGVRVYSYDGKETLPPLSAERATLGLTAGKRDGGVGGQTRKPLQVLVSKLTRSGSALSIECATSGNN